MKKFMVIFLAAFVAVGAFAATNAASFNGQVSYEAVLIPSNVSGADPTLELWGGLSGAIKLGSGNFYPVATISAGAGFFKDAVKYPWANAGIGLGAFTDPVYWSVVLQAGLTDFDLKLVGYVAAPVNVSFGVMKLSLGSGVILPFIDKSKDFATKESQIYTGYWVEPGIGFQFKNGMEFGLKGNYGKTNRVISGDVRPSGGLEFYQDWMQNFGTFLSVKMDGWHLDSAGKEKPMYHLGARVKL